MKNYNHRKLLLTLTTFLFLFISVLIPKETVHGAGDYYLQINKATNVVTVFRNDGTPYTAFICSVGAATPIGTFNTSQKLRWHELVGPSYGQYCTRITGSILFHSVWYYQNGNNASQSYREYNKLGTTASHGCVRLTVADAKWIYDNCPLGTRVSIIYGSSANDPLGKPESIKVNSQQYMGWDPTDPAAGNPYANAFPRIDANWKGKTIECGSAFNPIADVLVTDSIGNDISPLLTYTGGVDTSRLGTYTINYSVRDSLGRTASTSVNYQVVDSRQASITGVKSRQTKEYNAVVNLKSNIKALTADQKNLSQNIKVKIISPGSRKENTYTKSKLKLTKTGTYRINYYVTNPNNNINTKVSSTIKVVDTKKPILSGVKSKRTMEYNSRVNLKSGISAKLVSKKSVTSKIVIKIKEPGAKKYKTLKSSGSESSSYSKYRLKKTGKYTVEYSVINPYNKKAVTKKISTLTVTDRKPPVITGVSTSKTIEYGTVVNLKSMVRATLLSKRSVLSSMTVTVMRPNGSKETLRGKNYNFNYAAGTYRVTYKAVNPTSKKSATKTMRVIVRDTKAPILSGVKSSMLLEYGSTIDLYTGITAKLVSGTAQTVSATVVKQGGTATPLVGTKYNFNQTGTYILTYKATNLTSKKVTTLNTTVTVRDTKEPVIMIDNNKTSEILINVSYDIFQGVQAKLVSSATNMDEKDLKAVLVQLDEDGQIIPGAVLPKIQEDGTIIFTEAGTYRITFSAVNSLSGKIASKAFLLTVTEPQIP